MLCITGLGILDTIFFKRAFFVFSKSSATHLAEIFLNKTYLNGRYPGKKTSNDFSTRKTVQKMLQSVLRSPGTFLSTPML